MLAVYLIQHWNTVCPRICCKKSELKSRWCEIDISFFPFIWWLNHSPFGELNQPACSDEACLCNKEGEWENQDFSLERLRNLDIAGVQGLDYENRLLQMMLAGAPAIKKFKLPPSLGQAYETFLPANSRGRWITSGDGVYRWTPN
jgi:hypothetical protein